MGKTPRPVPAQHRLTCGRRCQCPPGGPALPLACTRAHGHLWNKHPLHLRPPSLRCCPPRDTRTSRGHCCSATPGTPLLSPRSLHQNCLSGRSGVPGHCIPSPSHAQVVPNAKRRWSRRPGLPVPKTHLGLGVPSAWCEDAAHSPQASTGHGLLTLPDPSPHPGGTLPPPRPCSLSRW